MVKNKNLEFGLEGRNKIREGVNRLASAVGSTLGPSGRNVIIQQENGSPVVTKDGVSVAKEIKLKDPVQNIGAEVLKEVSMRAAKKAGDGTTTATVLAAAMYNEGLKAVMAGLNVVELKRGMDKAATELIDAIQDVAVDVVTNDEIKQIATISANNDSSIGAIIASAMDSVGKDGVIQVQESKTAETSLEIVEGMRLDKGFVSPYFVNDNQTMIATLENPYILLCDKKISSVKEVLALLETCSKQNKPLLIIADDVDGEALAAMIVNKARGILNVCAVKAPGFGDNKLQNLEDIAVLTGGQVVSTQKGMKLEKLTTEMLGTARTIRVSQDETVIVDGGGSEEAIKLRVDQITNQYENSDSDYEKKGLQARMSKLIGGVAVIHIGAPTEVELREKVDRVDDALSATRAAVEEGIVPGGGLCLLRAGEAVSAVETTYTHPDQKAGRDIVLRACAKPFEIILENAGKTAAHILVGMAEAKKDGYNARTDEYVNMMEAGIIDPAKVTITALELAVSAAGTLLSTECVVSIDPEEEKKEERQPQYMM
uniref:Chaperonin GroEL n=1 Tax=uncultured virus TaxID=340016 RepID=A0A219YK69_9VIRU|nr:chaperonin GroEL [uncultured virus]